ncbi:protein SPT2 homolog [Planococcus citri]|uniref:protein SPT2 homolog n=1 Tax=Planococcus citri TaxID=170843 RepID=UPI0031F78F98
MDFGSLLYKAQKNDQDNKQSAGYYRTTFAPPKKERRQKELSANIQKFLAKKEEEEKQKRLEAERKKQELLALRNKDKKSFKRVKSMLTKTKSANKSVIEDAVDNVNTAVTANGPAQPDEDDYGYVSKDAEDLYNKLINKYNNMPPEESKFSKSSSKCSKDVLSTKDRVKAALLREEEEKFLPKKRKRKSKNGEAEEEDKSDDEKKDVEKEEKKEDTKNPSKFKIPKRNVQQPPPIDFQSLLKLAEKKQHEPIMIEKKVEEKPERPMTEKEKQEYLREKERRLRKEMGISENSHKTNELSKAKTMKSKSEMTVKNQNVTPSSAPVDKLKNDRTSDLKRSQPSTSSSQKPMKTSPSPKKVRIEEPKLETSKEEKSPANTEKPALGVLSERQKMLLAHKRNSELETKKMALLEARRKEAKLNGTNQSKEPFREKLSNTSSKISRSESPVSKISKPMESHSSKNIPSKPLTSKKPISSNIPSRQFPPPDVVRQFPPPDVTRRFPPSDTMRNKPKPPMRRKVIESDEEYDSEMDDFIDDSEQTDVSSFITEIFGYDRRKYAGRGYEDDDDECMESNFSQLQKEEYISTKHGILEDLADVRREKAEKMRKKKRIMY